jgi:hypothetical protein
MNSKGDIILPAHQANKEYNIPLYTHPAKTLTDEEIWKLWQQHLDDEIPVFVRAILKKASEK